MSIQGTKDHSDAHAASVIGRGIEIKGSVTSTGDIQIDGRVEGDIQCNTLVVGETGRIAGTIQANRALVSGAVEGSIEVKDLAIEASARISGEIVYSRLKMTSGGIVEGTLSHRASEESAADGNGLKLVGMPQQVKPRAVYVD